MRARTDSSFNINPHTVLGWSYSARYESGISEAFARELHDAVTNEKSGILPWLKTQW